RPGSENAVHHGGQDTVQVPNGSARNAAIAGFSAPGRPRPAAGSGGRGLRAGEGARPTNCLRFLEDRSPEAAHVLKCQPGLIVYVVDVRRPSVLPRRVAELPIDI